MKVLLELLADVRQLLSAIDSLDDVRPDGQEKLKVLLESLMVEAVRLLEADAPMDNRRESMFQRALEAISKQRLDEAARILDAAIAKYPNDAELHNHLGLVAWERGDLEEAIAHYDDAMAAGFPAEGHVDWYHERYRPFLRAMEGRALCLYRLGKLTEALPLFEALADMNSVEYGGCRYLAGEVRHTLGELHEAVRDYERVPAEPAVLYNLALAYFETGRLEDSATTLIKAFVGNTHIAELLLGRNPSTISEVPGYLAGEMIDWDAPTGGFLIQGCVSQVWLVTGQRLYLFYSKEARAEFALAAERRISVETAAREARYEHFADAARTAGARATWRSMVGSRAGRIRYVTQRTNDTAGNAAESCSLRGDVAAPATGHCRGGRRAGRAAREHAPLRAGVGSGQDVHLVREAAELAAAFEKGLHQTHELGALLRQAFQIIVIDEEDSFGIGLRRRTRNPPMTVPWLGFLVVSCHLRCYG